LDTRLTTAEGTISTNTTDIATNATDIATNTTDIATNATAITGLDTRLTTAEGTISTNTADITANATAISNETSARTTADSAIQAELDATQTGAGLGTDGAYTANGGTNYVASATSLFDADVKLDAAIKVNADAISSLSAAVGGDTGELSALTTDAKSTLVAAINEVDAHADANAASIATNTSDIATNAAAITANANAITAEETARIAADALDLKIAANLSDVADVAAARTNLGIYSTSEVDSAIATATANIMNVVSEQLVVSGDLITTTQVPASGVILNFNTVRFVDENGNAFDIPVTITATAGGQEFQLHGDSAGQFDTKTVTVQYMYQ